MPRGFEQPGIASAAGSKSSNKGKEQAKTKQWKALGEIICGAHAEKFTNYMNKLWNSNDQKEQDKAAQVYLQTIEYFQPKLARTESDVNVNTEEPITIVMPKK